MPAVAEKIEERSRSSVLAIPTSTSLATLGVVGLERFAGGVEVLPRSTQRSTSEIGWSVRLAA